MDNQILKTLFNDIEKGMITQIIMSIAKKSTNGIPVKEQFVANIGNLMFGNGASPSFQVAVGYQMDKDAVIKYMSEWSESKKGIFKGIIFELLIHDKVIEEEFVSTKKLFADIGINDPKFNVMAAMVIPNSPWG
jgi:hypothetical protein